MGLFNFGKKKKETKPVSNEQTTEKEVAAVASTTKIESVKILGGGCAKCNQLEAATQQALSELGINIKIDHVTDFSVIATYGVMTTPAIVVNEKVLSFGKVLKSSEVVALLKKV